MLGVWLDNDGFQCVVPSMSLKVTPFRDGGGFVLQYARRLIKITLLNEASAFVEVFGSLMATTKAYTCSFDSVTADILSRLGYGGGSGDGRPS